MPPAGPFAAAASASRFAAPPARSAVDMILAHLNVLEHTQRIVRQDGEGAIKRDEIGGDRLVVDAHEADRKALRELARETRLEEADDALLGFARADEQN